MDSLLSNNASTMTPARKGVINRASLLVSPVARAPVVPAALATHSAKKASPMRERNSGGRLTPSPRKRLNVNGRQNAPSPLKRASPASTSPKSVDSSRASSSTTSAADVSVEVVAKLRAEIEHTRQQLALAQQERDAAYVRSTQLESELSESTARHNNAMMFQSRNLEVARQNNASLQVQVEQARALASEFEARVKIMSEEQQAFARVSAQHASSISVLQQRLAAADARCSALEQQLQQAQSTLAAAAAAESARKEADDGRTAALSEQLARLQSQFDVDKQHYANELAECQQQVATAQREYFFSAALALKLGMFMDGQPITFALQPHYEELVASSVPFAEWPRWIQQRIAQAAAQSNARPMYAR